jgi:transposase-like protein
VSRRITATSIGRISDDGLQDKRTCWRCGRTNKVNKARAGAIADYLCRSCKDVLALMDRSAV